MYDLVRIAKEFSSPDSLKEYLKEHPHADKSKHYVKKDHGDHYKKDDSPKKSLKERLKSLSQKAQSFVKNAPKDVSKFLNDDAHRRKVLTDASAALEKAPAKVVKNVVDTVKHEVHEFKEAGAGIKAVLSGKKMNDHQKKALKTVAFHVGLTVAATALTATGGPLAGLAMFGKSMVKHVAMKSASNALGHLHVLQELGHVSHGVGHGVGHALHGIKHILDKLAAEKAPDESEILVQFVMALMAKEIDKLGDEDVANVVEQAAGDGEEKQKKASAETNLTLAVRVASRFVAAWGNGANGTYVNVRWSKAKWQVEESDTPMGGFRDVTEESKLDTYEMPTLEADLKGKSENLLASVTAEMMWRRTGVKADDKGPEVRQKIVKAYDELFKDLAKQWEEDGDSLRLRQFKELEPKLRKKLVWKKVRGAK